MSTPDPKNLYLGAGETWFDRFDASGNPTGILRHLGNVDELTHNSSVDKITKKSSMSGARGVLAEVITGMTSELGLTLSEYESNNLALALLGKESAFLQTAEAGVVDREIDDALVLDQWYELKDANGKGVFNPTVTAFKQAAVTLNALAYELRAECGMVRFLSSYVGADKATAGAAVTWTGSTPEIAVAAKKRVVQALATGKVQGRLRYISATDQANGPRICLDAWIVNLSPDGDLSLIGEEFGSFKLKGTVQEDPSKPVGERYIRTVYL